MGYQSNQEVTDMDESRQLSSWKRALPQLIAVSIKNVLLMAFGMTLGFPTILIPGLTDPREPYDFTKDGLSWIGSVHLICVPIGSVIAGGVTQYLGRKRSMQLVNIPFVVAWMIFRFSNAEWHVFAALALTGFAGGFLEAPVLTYVAEITQPKLRGFLSSTSSMSVIAGVLIMFCLGTVFHWRTVALISSIFNVVSFTCLFFIPESPHWLISKNRLLDARKSLAWLRGWTTLEDIESEYKEIYAEVKESDKNNRGHDNPVFDGDKAQNNGTNASDRVDSKRTMLETAQLFTKKNFLWPFLIVTMAFSFTHVSGMTTLQTYAVPIFESLKAPMDKYYATTILGTAEFLGSVLATALVHYTGKRLLNFVSYLASGTCFAIVGTYAYYIGATELVIVAKNSNITTMALDAHIDPKYTDYNWVPLTFLAAGAFLSLMGHRILPWILTGELFNNETRATAAGICGAFSYIAMFVVNKAFFKVVGVLSLPGTFWAHGAMCALAFVVMYFLLPETEGKTLGQINEHFNGGTKMGNSVYRGKKHQQKKVQKQQKKLGLSNDGFKSEEHISSNNFESKL